MNEEFPELSFMAQQRAAEREQRKHMARWALMIVAIVAASLLLGFAMGVSQ